MQMKKGVVHDKSLVAEETHHRVTEDDVLSDDEIMVPSNVYLMFGDVASGSR